MDIIRAEQIALDDALVAPANCLKIGKSNLRLSSDLNSKEATLQVVYDVLKLTPFYKAFQITTDVPEIYIGEIKVITDVNVNKLHQPWRSFAVVINKCVSGKSTKYDSLRLSQAQILWGMYHKKNVDYAYLLWEDFVYQVENKNVKRSNEMYYPHFTKLYGAILPNELMNEAIKNSDSYKEYYVIALGAEPLKTKASVKKKQARFDKAPNAPQGKRLKVTAKVTKPSKKKLPTQGLDTLSEVALTKEEQMRIITKRSLTQFHSSHASGSGANEETDVKPGVPDVPKYGSDDEQISWKFSSDEDDNAER
ncbi:hypothetical protein Tco_0881522 [Tanacetum coccineum]